MNKRELINALDKCENVFVWLYTKGVGGTYVSTTKTDIKNHIQHMTDNMKLGAILENDNNLYLLNR